MKAWLFDLDGTLARNEPLKGRALAEACASYDRDVDHRIYADVMGEDWLTVTRHFFRHCALEADWEVFDERFRGCYLALLDAELTPTPGAALFLQQAKSHGLAIGIVSSAAPWMVERVLSRLALPVAFDVVVTQADVVNHKPDPAPYLLALSRLGLAAGDVLVFEDSAAGLEAAAAAGCRTVAIRHDFNTGHDFSAALFEASDFIEVSELLDRFEPT